MTTTATPTGIMGRLKAETAEQHAIAESKPLEAALVGGSIAHDQYKEYLAQRWLIHRELEAATDRVLEEDHRLAHLGLPGLYQTAHIEADLDHLGVIHRFDTSEADTDAERLLVARMIQRAAAQSRTINNVESSGQWRFPLSEPTVERLGSSERDHSLSVNVDDTNLPASE